MRLQTRVPISLLIEYEKTPLERAVEKETKRRFGSRRALGPLYGPKGPSLLFGSLAVLTRYLEPEDPGEISIGYFRMLPPHVAPRLDSKGHVYFDRFLRAMKEGRFIEDVGICPAPEVRDLLFKGEALIDVSHREPRRSLKHGITVDVTTDDPIFAVEYGRDPARKEAQSLIYPTVDLLAKDIFDSYERLRG